MDAKSGVVEEGLQILARIIARSWAKRYLTKASEAQASAVANDVKSSVVAEPVPMP